jgi:hypothetical protein
LEDSACRGGKKQFVQHFEEVLVIYSPAVQCTGELKEAIYNITKYPGSVF